MKMSSRKMGGIEKNVKNGREREREESKLLSYIRLRYNGKSYRDANFPMAPSLLLFHLFLAHSITCDHVQEILLA